MAPQRSLLWGQPIAIVGMACRFPGAPNVEAYWRLMVEGRTAIRGVPSDRWTNEEDPALSATSKKLALRGGFLDEIAEFDAGFFNISPREAEHMDPQQRLLLEVAWEALEDAGFALERVAGSDTGVFIGCGRFDHALRTFGERGGPDGYDNTGSMLHAIPGRVSYLLDLCGPAMAVDTACSSSLVAVHVACQSLRSGETSAAVAGGVHLMLHPSLHLAISESGVLSPEGRCKTFDASADGYVRAEGCGVVILRRLSDALRDGDRIYALIRGSAVNHCGHGSGFTAPNAGAQEQAFRRALHHAGIAASEVSYVEAHGTATLVGDPIELTAVKRIYGERPPSHRPCAVASVKTNIGHLEPASGIAGLMKAALCLWHEAIPPHLNFSVLNPKITLDGAITIPTVVESWARGTEKRYAATNSFGISGVNAHVVLEEGPCPDSSALEESLAPNTDAYLLPLSARSPGALHDLVCAHEKRISNLRDEPRPSRMLYDTCYTAATRRTHHHYRAVFAFASRDDLAARLRSYLKEDVAMRDMASPQPRKVAFAFSGQGAQWWGMGRELVEREPVFKAQVDECDGLLRRHTSWSLLDELRRPEAESRLAHTEFANPALFAIQIALVALLRHWGIEPTGVVGHSVGEVASAYVGGCLTLEDALEIAFHRGRLMERLAGLGSMSAVGIPEREAREAIEGLDGVLCIAAINSPRTTVLSGDSAALDRVTARLESAGVFVRRVNADHAFHSHQTDPILDELVASLSAIHSRPSAIPVFSTVTGRCHGMEHDDWSGAYWGRNVREPVNFMGAIGAMLDAGYDAFLEIGPHPVLSSNVSDCARDRAREVLTVASLRRGQCERQTLLTAAGSLYAVGHPIVWSNLYPAGRCVPLPSYPWQRERFWRSSPSRTPISTRSFKGVSPPIAGGVVTNMSNASIGDSLAGVAPGEHRRQLLESYLSESISSLLGYDTSQLRSDASFMSLGLDSMMAAHLVQQLDVDLRVTVHMADILNGTGIRELASRLDATLPSLTAEQGRPSPPPNNDLLEVESELSDEAVDGLLRNLLSSDMS